MIAMGCLGVFESAPTLYFRQFVAHSGDSAWMGKRASIVVMTAEFSNKLTQEAAARVKGIWGELEEQLIRRYVELSLYSCSTALLVVT